MEATRISLHLDHFCQTGMAKIGFKLSIYLRISSAKSPTSKNPNWPRYGQTDRKRLVLINKTQTDHKTKGFRIDLRSLL